MISTNALCKTVTTVDGDLRLLDSISFELEEGQSLAIVGSSGAGKSTLLGLLAGLDTATSGDIFLDQHQISNLDEEQRAAVRAKLVGFVFQSFQLLPGLTAEENVALPLELKGQAEASKIAQDYLARVGLAERLRHYPKQLSGGEQQRVALARAFACRPKILFADEPTGNLDTKTGQNVIELLFELNAQESTTLVLVTHEARLADRCSQNIVIEAGRIME